MAVLYADENFFFPTVVCLRALGHDVITALEDGRAGNNVADRFVLARAHEFGRAVLTFDRSDYRRLHNSFPDHSGIIACSEDHNFPSLAERIHTALNGLPVLIGVFLRIVKPNPSEDSKQSG